MKNSLLLTVIPILLSFVSCVAPEPSPAPEKPSAPVVTGVAPSGVLPSTAVSKGQVFTVTYDQNIRCSLANQKKISVNNGASIGNVTTYGAELRIAVADLAYETSYTVNIAAGCIEGFKNNQDASAAANFQFSTPAKPVEPDPVIPVDPDKIPERGTSVAWQMQENLGLGFNFGNNMDAFRNGDWAGEMRDVPDETCWVPEGINPKYISQTAMDKLKSYGFKSVRIPISWLKKIGPAPDYKIDEAWMERVAEIVGYAEKAGLYCIINTHHDENFHDTGSGTEYHWQDILGALQNPSKNEEIKREITAVWTQIAERFIDKGDFLIMESFNEINDGGWGWSARFKANPQEQYDILNDWNQVFVDAVRATGGCNATRWLGIPGYAANPDFTVEGLVLPEDSAGKIMVGVHCYDPYNYNTYSTDGNYKSEWGHTADPSKRCSSDDERAIRTTMAKLYDRFIAKGIPCYFGEFGSINRPTAREQAFEKYWFEYFTKCARSFGLPAFLWDNQGLDVYSMGFINHGNGEYIMQGREMVEAMLKGMNTTSNSYTLQTVYDNAPKF